MTQAVAIAEDYLEEISRVLSDPTEHGAVHRRLDDVNINGLVDKRARDQFARCEPLLSTRSRYPWCERGADRRPGTVHAHRLQVPIPARRGDAVTNPLALRGRLTKHAHAHRAVVRVISTIVIASALFNQRPGGFADSAPVRRRCRDAALERSVATCGVR